MVERDDIALRRDLLTFDTDHLESMARAGDITSLVDCDQPGWYTKGEFCFVGTAPDKMTYGWRVR